MAAKRNFLAITCMPNKLVTFVFSDGFMMISVDELRADGAEAVPANGVLVCY